MATKADQVIEKQCSPNTNPLVGAPAASSSVPAACFLWINRAARSFDAGLLVHFAADTAVRGALRVRQRAGFVTTT
jgi:hypothetical protein